jgi:hypothetical protein
MAIGALGRTVVTVIFQSACRHVRTLEAMRTQAFPEDLLAA